MEGLLLLGGLLVPGGFCCVGLLAPQEDICLSVAEEEADPPSDRLAKVDYF